MAKLTKRRVDSTHPGPKDIWVWDDELRGFGMRVKPSGVKSYCIQYRNAFGATRRFTIGQHGKLTADQARRDALQLLAKVERGEDPSRDRKAVRAAPTMNHLIDRYLVEHVRVHNSAATEREAVRLTQSHVRPAFGTKKVAGISPSDVMRLHRGMADTPRQANIVLAILSKIFNLAEAWELRPPGSNPCRHVKHYSENKRERFLTEFELQRVGEIMCLLELENRVNGVVVNAIKLLALSGCRLNEILTLKWENVDPRRSALVLPNTKTGPRVHVIGALALAFVSNLERTEGSPWVFCSTDPKNPMRKERLQKAWRVIRSLAEIEDVRLHDLRHTVGTYSGQTGANAFLVRDKLGHKTIAMTNRYVNQDTNPIRELSDTVEARIAGALMGGDSAEIIRMKS